MYQYYALELHVLGYPAAISGNWKRFLRSLPPVVEVRVRVGVRIRVRVTVFTGRVRDKVRFCVRMLGSGFGTSGDNDFGKPYRFVHLRQLRHYLCLKSGEKNQTHSPSSIQ